MTGIATITIDGRDVRVRSIDGQLWLAIDDLGTAVDIDRIAKVADARFATMSDIDSYPTPDAAAQIKRWIADRIVFSLDARTWAHDLYVDYRSWCVSHNVLPTTEAMFGRRATKAGWHRKHVGGRAYYHRVGIVDAIIDDPFAEWAKTRLTFGGTARTWASDLYIDYNSWCRSKGVDPRSQSALGKWLTNQGVKRSLSCGHVRRLGVAIRRDTAPT